ncbi:MAG: hypothetical protein ACK5ML_07945 [Lachnospiraceae bacterium]
MLQQIGDRPEEFLSKELKRAEEYAHNQKWEQSFSILTHLANAGYVPAILKIAEWYRDGIYVKQNFHKMLEYVEKSMVADSEGMYQTICSELEESAFLLQSYKVMMDQEDPEGFAAFAEAYEKGELLDRDMSKSVEYYAKAAERNNFTAISRLVSLSDDGIPQARKKVMQLCMDQNSHFYDPEKGYELAIELIRAQMDQDGSLMKILYDAARSGNPLVALLLGGYLFTEGITEEAISSGLKWLKEAQSRYEQETLPYFCIAYDLGRGVETNKSVSRNMYDRFSGNREQLLVYYSILSILSRNGDTVAQIMTAYHTLYEGGQEMEPELAAQIIESKGSMQERNDLLLLASYYKRRNPIRALSFLDQMIAPHGGMDVAMSSEENIYYLTLKWEVQKLILQSQTAGGKLPFSPDLDLWGTAQELTAYADHEILFHEYSTTITEAILLLADAYYKGEVIAKDFVLSVKYYQQAYPMDEMEGKQLARLAFCKLNGLGCEKDISYAMEVYVKAAQRNHAQSAYIVGNCYRYGYNGFKQDPVLGADYFEKSAELGYEDAVIALASCYQMGIGRRLDLDLARQMLLDLVEQGNREAVRALEKMDARPAQEISLDLVFNRRDPKKSND